MTDVQQTVKDVQAVTPYVWEIGAFIMILVSLTITNVVKKWRWFPMFMCKLKKSKDGHHLYKKLKKPYLVTLAMALSFAGVSWCLFHRYTNAEDVLVISGVVCVMQWGIVDLVFKLTQGTKYEKAGEIIREGLYVDDDATIFVKTVATCTGGGVDRRKLRKDDIPHIDPTVPDK